MDDEEVNLFGGGHGRCMHRSALDNPEFEFAAGRKRNEDVRAALL